MTRPIPDAERKYRWHTIRCKRCGRRHNAERPNAKFCSEACSKAYRRDLAERREEATMAQEVSACPDKLNQGGTDRTGCPDTIP